jgi:hypothetical protein
MCVVDVGDEGRGCWFFPLVLKSDKLVSWLVVSGGRYIHCT